MAARSLALVKVLFLFAELAQRSQLCRKNGKFSLGSGYVDEAIEKAKKI